VRKAALVEEFLLRLEGRAKMTRACFPVGAKDGENALAAGGDTQIKEPGLNLESG